MLITMGLKGLTKDKLLNEDALCSLSLMFFFA